MAKVVDVTDVDDIPGAGMLHFDDGRPPLMALPEIADDYRTHLGLKDNRVAGPGGGEDDTATKARDADVQNFKDTVGGAASAVKNFFTTPMGRSENAGTRNHPVDAAPPGPAYQAPPQGPMSPVNAPPPQAAPPPQSSQGVPPMLARPPDVQAAPAPAPQPGQPPSTDELVGQAQDATRRRAADELLNGKQLPYSAGSPAGYRPTTSETTTERGAPYDPQMAGLRMDADRQVLDAQMAQAKQQRDQADAQAAHAAAMVPVYQQQQATAQAQIDHKQQQYEQQRARLEDDLQQYSESAKPDPDRYFKNRSDFSNIMSTIGQALGAAGGALTHSPNWAFEIVQNNIKNDIQTQVANYQAGRADRTSAISRMVDYYHGDMSMAQQALNIAMNKVVQTEANQFAAQSQSQQVTGAANVFSAQFQKDSMEREQALFQQAMGKTTTKDSEKYHDAVAAGTGRKPLTDAERAAREKILKGGTAQDFGGMNARSVAMQKRAYGEKKENMSNAFAALDEEADAMNLKLNHETGEVLDKTTGKPVDPDKVSLPGVGPVASHVPNLLTSREGTRLRRAQTNSVRTHAKAVYGVELKAGDAEDEVPHIVGQTNAEAVQSLRQRFKELVHHDRDLDATADSIGAPIVESRKQSEKDVNYSRATGSSLPNRQSPNSGFASDEGSESDSGGGSE